MSANETMAHLKKSEPLEVFFAVSISLYDFLFFTFAQINKPGKYLEPKTIQNGNPVTDFAWDPLNDDRLVVSCDDARIRVWVIPPYNEFNETLTEPQQMLRGRSSVQ